MRHTVTLERGTDGGYMAWVHELPGCFARAATREEIEAKIPLSIAEFLAWARGGRTASLEAIEFKIVEEVMTPKLARDADSDVLLQSDRAPLTSTAWVQVDRWLRRSRKELLQLLQETDEPDFDRKPEGCPRSVREAIMHVAFAEFMYAAWTFDLRSRRGMEAFLRWTRRITLLRMRALARSDRGAVTQAEWEGAPRPEAWTARKAARRLVWHERLHLKAIKRLLAREPGN